MSRILSLTRYFVLLGVIASLAISVALFISLLAHAGILILEVARTLGDFHALKGLAIDSIELVDFCLLATALYIVGIGLYELFIGHARLPTWLRIVSLDDLKDRLINVVVVILAVSFLSQVATWDGVTNLLPFGASIGAVIFALTAFGLLRLGQRDKDGQEERAHLANATPVGEPTHTQTSNPPDEHVKETTTDEVRPAAGRDSVFVTQPRPSDDGGQRPPA
jgi:uncharacterized membrane protein YqhA